MTPPPEHVQRATRRLLALCIPTLLLVLLDPGWALAAGSGIGVVRSFATRLTGYVTTVAASVAVLFLAVNGVRWTMSMGNPMRQSDARHGLVAAATGLVIALSAGVIVQLVVGALA